MQPDATVAQRPGQLTLELVETGLREPRVELDGLVAGIGALPVPAEGGEDCSEGRPTLYEIALALSSLTGEPHPLAPPNTEPAQGQPEARVPLPRIYPQIYDDGELPD